MFSSRSPVATFKPGSLHPRESKAARGGFLLRCMEGTTAIPPLKEQHGSEWVDGTGLPTPHLRGLGQVVRDSTGQKAQVKSRRPLRPRKTPWRGGQNASLLLTWERKGFSHTRRTPSGRRGFPKCTARGPSPEDSSGCKHNPARSTKWGVGHLWVRGLLRSMEAAYCKHATQVFAEFLKER